MCAAAFLAAVKVKPKPLVVKKYVNNFFRVSEGERRAEVCYSGR